MNNFCTCTFPIPPYKLLPSALLSCTVFCPSSCRCVSPQRAVAKQTSFLPTSAINIEEFFDCRGKSDKRETFCQFHRYREDTTLLSSFLFLILVSFTSTVKGLAEVDFICKTACFARCAAQSVAFERTSCAPKNFDS